MLKTETMTYQEWDELVTKANKIDDLKFPNKSSSPTKDAQFDAEEYMLNVFNQTKYDWMKAREEEYKFNRGVVNKKFDWVKNVSGIGLLVCGFICGWLAHG